MFLQVVEAKAEKERARTQGAVSGSRRSVYLSQGHVEEAPRRPPGQEMSALSRKSLSNVGKPVQRREAPQKGELAAGKV